MVNRSVEMKNPNTPVLSRVNHRKYSLVSGFSFQEANVPVNTMMETQQQHHYGDTVNSYRVTDVKRGIPYDAVCEKHFSCSSRMALSDVRHREVGRKRQQQSGTGHHHSSDLIDVCGQSIVLTTSAEVSIRKDLIYS